MLPDRRPSPVLVLSYPDIPVETRRAGRGVTRWRRNVPDPGRINFPSVGPVMYGAERGDRAGGGGGPTLWDAARGSSAPRSAEPGPTRPGTN
ncbi:hypothetical protein AAFF_G00253530 [Aldrovandia affinis]|uniref:Uncharacterized protein n=1 Tax=Aldrovandia affinis TaxID=143900 RepID=A0AAD7WTQ2_9TELE|nr:hypothetical protein AAFF_G00253530 [Aldrovandia affinis]